MFAAIGMSTLMRGAVLRALQARLASERLNRELERELEEGRRLRAEAQELAVRAEAANRAKSEFLATISHEIRTPLNGVLGMTQAMSRGPLDPAQSSRLGLIESSARTLLDIVNDVLDISKIEAGKMTLAPAPFRLDAFAEGLRRLYEVLAAEKGLRFSLSLSDASPGQRLGDEVRLRQILSNLISNALKFTEAGEIRVVIEARGDTVCFAVHDTGVGIAPADQPAVFEKFVQTDGSNTRRAGGTGLGLAICRDLARLMGGEISLTSTPGVGSVFSVTVPLDVVHADIPAPAANETFTPALVAAAGGGPRVLVVDDNATNRMVLQAILEQNHIRVDTAGDGREALVAWRDGPWDAILMDVNMPNMDGLDATRAIRQAEADGRRGRTPIIAVTASVLSHETEAYRAAGMDEVLAKPVDLDSLMETLNRRIPSKAA